MLEELIINHTTHLGYQLGTFLTQAAGEIASAAANCDPSTEMCAMNSTANATSIYDDVS
jgi:hypothetical protein